MLSLSMVVIGALVGAGGLGVPVVRALNTVQIGMGVEAGFVTQIRISADSGADNGTRNGSAASVPALVGGTSIQNPR